jgi:hypothetical protein
MEACWEALDELEELQRDYANSAGTLLEVEPELAVTLLVLVDHMAELLPLLDQMAELEVEPELAVTLLALMDQMAELEVEPELAVLLVY